MGVMQVSLAQSPEQREAIDALRYAIDVEEMGKSPPAADHQRRWIRDPLDATLLPSDSRRLAHPGAEAPELSGLHGAAVRAQAHRGDNRRIGRQLGRLLEAAAETLAAAEALVDDPQAWALVGVFLASGS
jgi:hypothetical protein